MRECKFHSRNPQIRMLYLPREIAKGIIGVEKRTARFDGELKIEAYRFEGIMQKFPNHFHEHYVLGFVESGRRFLTCKNIEYIVGEGDLLLFNPLDNHACEQADDRPLDWRCLNIETSVMRKAAAKITGRDEPPVYAPTVVPQSDAVPVLRELHAGIIEQRADKAGLFNFLMKRLLVDYVNPPAVALACASGEIRAACDYMERNFTESITLADLAKISRLNKHTLLRSFTLQKGLTPYQYLSALRVNKAKKLLEAGKTPTEAALATGFSDQSHFTRFFKNFIGLTPKAYRDIFREGAK